MVLVIISCLFVILGMYIGKKYDLKSESINSIFGLFIMNTLVNIFPKSYLILSKNYHGSTMFYVVLGSILGYLLMKLISYKYDDVDNVSIIGFTTFNSFLLFISKFNFLFLVINILYYIIIGIYVRNSKSWISVIIGMVLGLVLGLMSGWCIGYVFSIIIGFLIYFIVSVYELVFRNKNKNCYYGLIVGLIVALIGGIL